MKAKAFGAPAIVDDVLREAPKLGSKVTDAVMDGVDAVKDGVRAANQQWQRGRDAAEDLYHDAKHAAKRNPVQAVAIGFAAGFLLGGLFSCAAMRRR